MKINHEIICNEKETIIVFNHIEIKSKKDAEYVSSTILALAESEYGEEDERKNS